MVNYSTFAGTLIKLLAFDPEMPPSMIERETMLNDWYTEFKESGNAEVPEIEPWARHWFGHTSFDTHSYQLKTPRLIKTPELMNEPIRSLFWKQPFANLMLHGKIETRTWHSLYTGLVLICASKAPYSIGEVQSISGEHVHRIVSIVEKESVPAYDWKKPFANIVCGHAIAVGRLVESRSMVKADEKKAFVKHHDDLFAHVYNDVTPIKPFPMVGQQGWKKLDSEIWDRIEFI